MGSSVLGVVPLLLGRVVFYVTLCVSGSWRRVRSGARERGQEGGDRQSPRGAVDEIAAAASAAVPRIQCDLSCLTRIKFRQQTQRNQMRALALFH